MKTAKQVCPDRYKRGLPGLTLLSTAGRCYRQTVLTVPETFRLLRNVTTSHLPHLLLNPILSTAHHIAQIRITYKMITTEVLRQGLSQSAFISRDTD